MMSDILYFTSERGRGFDGGTHLDMLLRKIWGFHNYKFFHANSSCNVTCQHVVTGL